MTKVNISDRMSHFIVEAEDISEEDFEALSQASNHSQFKFEEDLEYNYEDDSDYLPSSQDSSSQEFSQVRRDDDYDVSEVHGFQFNRKSPWFGSSSKIFCFLYIFFN